MTFAKAFLVAVIACALSGTAWAAPARQKPHGAADRRSAALKPDVGAQPARQLGLGEHSPTEELGFVLSCMISLAHGALGDVQKQCSAAIKLDTRDPAPYKLRGVSYLFQKRFEPARVDFKEASRLDPTDPENHAGYGEALRGQGNYDDAIRQFGIAIKLAPSDARMWNARCWTRGAFDRDLQRGLADCNTALRLSPAHPGILDSRGLIYLRLGNLNLAERDFNASLRQQPELATSLYGRGIAKMRRGDMRGAQRDILAARSIDQTVDDIFFWQPLISQKCLTGIVQDHGWRCRPSKRAPVKKAAPTSKTASAAKRDRVARSGRGTPWAQ
ncbi:MAG: tetratricopeptide repeat protein [Rhizomicrobium sp.]